MKKFLVGIVSFFMLASASALRAENIGVPAECEDVMLQAFYWDSYKMSGTKYGCTMWSYLMKDSIAIRDNFDLVWFPPSANSNGGGVGYYHYKLSDQNSEWGRKAYLTKLIDALHRGGTKVIADIVINHRKDKNWCSFEADNFGEGYGSFQLETKHICRYDECFVSDKARDEGSPCYGSDLSTRGAEDTGENDGGARDLDHTNPYVQNWAKAYVRWMLEVMKYDGFRYDMTKGYDGKYLKMYNEEAKPYFSVSECWDNANFIKDHLAATGYNTMVFDFPLKWDLNDAFKPSNANYGKLKTMQSMLRGRGLAKYTVTFVDNHDTFQRTNTESDIQNSTDGASANDRALMLQCNAYILSMPGVPCVFWPHWVKYQTEIQKMIIARKSAGIHSESTVSEQSGNGWYEATVTGKNGKVVLYLGSSATKAAPEGYTLALKENKIAMYYTGETYVPGTDTGGGGGEVMPEIDPDVYDGVTYKFYAMGWINSSDAGEAASKTYDDKYLFKDGKLTIECKQGSYIGIKDEQGNFYYTKGNSDTQGNKATCYWANGWSPCRKWALVEGTHYIIMRKVKFKGEIVLESVDKATYDAYHIIPQAPQAIENTEVKEQARKVIVNGQLRILRGDKVYTVTGMEIR